MVTNAKQIEEKFKVKRYKIQYPISAYTFPQEARIKRIRFDAEYMHVDLMDGRILSVPLKWIPTLYNAAPEEREKYEISRERTMIIWNPAKCAINEDLDILAYLGPSRE